MTSPKDETHIPALDGVRGLAILMVMVFHFDPQFGLGPGLDRLVGAVAHLGQLGVDLFFVLSGYLITGILLRSKGSERYLRNFYMRRILRIFPLYYGTLIMLYVIAPALTSTSAPQASEQWWFWLYLQNIGMTFSTVSGPGHFWSLAVEEHFYLVWPFLVFWCPIRYLYHVLVSIVALALVSRAILLLLGYEVFFFTPCRMDALAMGAILAVIAHTHNSGCLTHLRRVAWYTFLPLPILAVCYALLSGAALDSVQLFKFPIIASLFCSLLILAQTSSIISAFFRVRILRTLGKYSYALYVIHHFLGASFDAHPQLRGLVGLALFLLINLALAWLSWHLWEKHFLQLKSRFSYRSTSGYTYIKGTDASVTANS